MISKPELTCNAGVYSLAWSDEKIHICIDRLDDRKHITTAEVTVRYRAPESTDYEHLHQARLNLTSTRERAALAKYLQDRVTELDWEAVLEQACVKTLQRHREGEPVQMVGNHPETQRNR